VAFGLPNRPALSATFIAMASATGLTSAITNPLHEEVRTAVAASDVLRGADRDCVAWIGRFREGPAPGAEGRRRGGREGRRRGTAAGGSAAGGSAAGAVDTPDAGGGAAGAAGEP
jgi:5-methyltetrahydrofolate--homocysteine methyltransferase